MIFSELVECSEKGGEEGKMWMECEEAEEMIRDR
jgi:hypothetical protein